MATMTLGAARPPGEPEFLGGSPTNPSAQTGMAPTNVQHTGMMPGINMPAQTGVAPTQAPPTGLIGAEQALDQGMGQARTDLQSAMPGSDVYTEGGQGAAGMQAALTGAMGPEAQQAAQANFSQSPAAQYQMEQMQRATERSAAARGGLMGGNVLRELQQNAAGIASQDYQNQFQNLGQVADRGFQRQSVVDQMKTGLARDLADTAFSAGIQRAGMRTRAGEQIAANARGAASQVGQYLNQQGIAVSDMMSNDISTITDMIYQTGIQENMNTQQLAAILANIAGGQASAVQQGQANIGAAKAAGTIGMGNAIQGGITGGLATGAIPTGAPRGNQVGMTGTGQQFSGYA